MARAIAAGAWQAGGREGHEGGHGRALGGACKGGVNSWEGIRWQEWRHSHKVMPG